MKVECTICAGTGQHLTGLGHHWVDCDACAGRGYRDDQEPLSPAGRLSPAARALYDELWEWLWNSQGEESLRTLGDKKAELRAKHGAAAEAEMRETLGLLP